MPRCREVMARIRSHSPSSLARIWRARWSGTVYPAAGFVREARSAGAETVEINLERSEGGERLFSRLIEGRASESVPRFVEQLLAGQFD